MKKQVLVVDDDAINRKVVEIIFNKIGWKVDEAEDGEVALSQAISERYEVILLDLYLPDIDGEDLCRQLRCLPEMNSTPIIAYAAKAVKEDDPKLLAAGFDAILVKPVSIQSFTSTIFTLDR